MVRYTVNLVDRTRASYNIHGHTGVYIMNENKTADSDQAVVKPLLNPPVVTEEIAFGARAIRPKGSGKVGIQGTQRYYDFDKLSVDPEYTAFVQVCVEAKEKTWGYVMNLITEHNDAEAKKAFIAEYTIPQAHVNMVCSGYATIHDMERHRDMVIDCDAAAYQRYLNKEILPLVRKDTKWHTRLMNWKK